MIVSSSSLPGDFFAEEALVTPCILGNSNEMRTTALLDTGATGYSFIDPSMARRVCDKLQIKSIRLSKPKAIRGFDGKQALDVTHAIYPTMTVQEHKETITLMLITKLGQHPFILGKPWMRKHGVILDMRNDRLTFWPGYCQHMQPHTEPLHAKQPHKELNAKAPPAEKPHAKEPQAGKHMKILKRPSNKPPELLRYLLPSTRGVSKVASTSEAVEPEKKKNPSTTPQKSKQKVKDETNLKDEKPSVE